MAKKETVKKTTAKKTTKKVAAKKAKKVEEVVVNEPIQTEEVVEEVKPRIKEEKLETEIVTEKEPEDDSMLQEQVIKHVASEILAENNNNLDEFLSIDKEEMVEKTKEKIEEIKKINNERVNQRIDSIFGYLWNGQEMDY